MGYLARLSILEIGIRHGSGVREMAGRGQEQKENGSDIKGIL